MAFNSLNLLFYFILVETCESLHIVKLPLFIYLSARSHVKLSFVIVFTLLLTITGFWLVDIYFETVPIVKSRKQIMMCDHCYLFIIFSLCESRKFCNSQYSVNLTLLHCVTL